MCSSSALPNHSKPSSENTSNNANTNKSDETSGYHTSSCKVDNSTKSCCGEKAIGDSTSGQPSAGGQDECRCEHLFEEKLSQPLQMSEDAAPDEEEPNLNHEFDWSIDQIALLNPCDITIDDNILLYKEFEQQNRSLLSKESEEFFKRKMIAPSPMVDTPILARKRLLQSQICKTSSPFIDYLNAKQPGVFKTPLQLSDIKETSSLTSNLSFKTPQHQSKHHTTPLNSAQTTRLPIDEKALPKKKLFHKFDSSSCSSKKATGGNRLLQSLSDSNARNFTISPALSEISQLHHDQLNCTDLDYRKFSLDFSGIGGEFNLNESNRGDHHHNPFKASTNRKQINRPIREEDELKEANDLHDEHEIKRLDLNDTNEMNELDKAGQIDNEINVIDQVIASAANDDGRLERPAKMNNDALISEEMHEANQEEMNHQEVNHQETNRQMNRQMNHQETNHQMNQQETKDGRTIEDVRMSVSMMQQSTAQCVSMMDCSFEDGEPATNDAGGQPPGDPNRFLTQFTAVNGLCNANQLLNVNQVPNDLPDDQHESLMETSSLV